MNWSERELLDKISENPDVKIEGSQVLEKGNRPTLAHPDEPKPHKYGVAVKEDRTYNGIVFHSKKEAQFAQELDLRIKAGDIDFWLRQVPFPLPGPSVYRLDFMTFKKVSCYWTIEYIEVKGRDLALGLLKRKQVAEIYGVHIEVI